ncbi:hypothetical protein RND71_028227 [Anisodus tanguticus]|uniref:Uncharacterized protein n=1 Tax=Anisodus tanguticus TaxID=243964 RepID=A0AAE1RI25_9SOLA|nr:hypothetical protein RND71_028227 [Anisodus tanguticus]
MATTSLSLSLRLPSAANNLNRHAALNIITCENTSPNQDRSCTRRPFLLGAGALSLSLIPASPLLAQGGKHNGNEGGMIFLMLLLLSTYTAPMELFTLFFQTNVENYGREKLLHL